MEVTAEIVEHIPIREVHIDGVAAMKIMKHCNESLPTMVAGSLLGIDIDGVLEVTYSYPFPAPRVQNVDDEHVMEDVDSTEYQIEMMKMLRDVNMDNNCVGWYQSTFMETIHTIDVVNYQYTYQCSDELSDNSVVIIYDPVQSRKGTLVLKAFRLSEEFMKIRADKSNAFIKPSSILEELPVRIKNAGHIAVFLRSLEDSHREALDCDFEPLSMTGTDTNLERRMELVGSWLEDLLQEQQKFQSHSKAVAKPRLEFLRWLNRTLQENEERHEAGEDLLPTTFESSGLKPLPEAPQRTEPLLMIGQLDRYAEQINADSLATTTKLFLTSQILSATSAGN